MDPTDQPAEILLIEDSPDDAAFFVHTFARTGVNARLEVLADGALALEYFFGADGTRHISRPPKLIVLDLKLPKVDGLEVLRALKADARTKSIPVVVLSSSLEERDLAASYRLGVNSYVVKPMDFDQYGDAVRTLARYWLQFNQTSKP